MKEKAVGLMAEVAKKSSDEILECMDETKLWDSLLHVELIVALEAEFDVFFEQEEIAEMDTPNKVLEHLVSKVGK